MTKRIKLRILILCMVLFSIGVHAQGRAVKDESDLSAKEIARRVLPSVILVISDSPNTEGYTQGSGFFVKPGILITNYHVIESNTRGIIQVAFGADQKKQNFRIARILAFDKESDLAVLSVPAAGSGLWNYAEFVYFV